MVNDYEDFQKYKDQILDVDEDINMDIKINPDYYIHFALMACQEALKNPDLNLMAIMYRHNVEHLENLIRASGMIPNDYNDLVKVELEAKEGEISKSMKIASKKFQVLTGLVFNRRSMSAPMKV